MKPGKPVLAMLVLSTAGLGGCVLDDIANGVQTSLANTSSPIATDQTAVQVAATKRAVTPANLAGPDAMPWQLMPASAASAAKGETTEVVERPGLGRIRGTRTALTQLDEKIVPYAKNGPIVTACKQAFDSQARAQGAYSIEAAAAGPERRTVKGRSQQVFFRIFYSDPKDSGVEVRQASVACSVGKRGELVGASSI